MNIVTAIIALGMMISTSWGAVRASYIDYEIGGKAYQGYLVQNSNVSGPRPVVLVVHEWYGLNDYAKQRAREIAALGYVAFAVDMYGKGVLAKDATEAGALAGEFYGNRDLFRERANAALDVVKQMEAVDTTKIAAIGFCYGGTAVLELARSGANVAGVVCFHGGVKSPTPDDAKNIKGRVLALQGANDPFVPEDELEAFEDEMKAANVNYTLIAYPETVHSFTNPANKESKMDGVKYNETSERAALEEMRAFLREIFLSDPPASDQE